MNKYLKVLILAVIFSFLWGLWWGLYKYERTLPASQRGAEIRLLTKTGFFSPQTVQDIESQTGIHVVTIEKSTDNELLREALSHNESYDLILISSYLARSFMLDNIFLPLNKEKLSKFKNVSIDFKNLDIDPENKYFLPIAWGLDGFIVNLQKVSLENETLSELMRANAKTSLLPSPIDLFNLAIKLKPIVKTWTDSGRTDELNKEIRDLKNIFTNFNADPRKNVENGTTLIAQMSNGLAAQLVSSGKFHFVLPEERGVLWLTLAGISKATKNEKASLRVLNALLSDTINQKYVATTNQASTLTTLNSSSLPPLQKALFIRQVPLSRVELFINHEALESTWMNAITKEWSWSEH